MTETNFWRSKYGGSNMWCVILSRDEDLPMGVEKLAAVIKRYPPAFWSLLPGKFEEGVFVEISNEEAIRAIGEGINMTWVRVPHQLEHDIMRARRQ